MRSKPFQYCVLWILAATSVGASFDSAMATSPLRACAARDRQVLMAIEERENANGISPQASIDPHQLTGILWFFHDPSADGGSLSADGGIFDAGADGPTGPSYPVDFFIDDIKFLPF